MPVNPELLQIAQSVLEEFHGPEIELQDVLQALQEKFGYVPPSVVGAIAEKLECSRPEVFTAIELSPSFSLTPGGQHKLYICNADNCCMQGGTELMQHAKQQLGIGEFETTTDEKIRLEPFQCLGNCSMAPNVMLNGRVFGMMDESGLDKLLDELE